jgi:hypothetical protein
VHDADENSATDMSRVFSIVKRIIQQYGCSFVFADHLRKPSRFAVGEDWSLRGSTDKMAAADSVLTVKMKDKNITVNHTKSRFCEAQKTFVVGLTKPTDDSIVLKYLGDAESISTNERLNQSREFVTEKLAPGIWISRRGLVNFAKEAKVLLKEGTIEREDRNPESGKGGKSAFYRKTSTEIN